MIRHGCTAEPSKSQGVGRIATKVALFFRTDESGVLLDCTLSTRCGDYLSASRRHFVDMKNKRPSSMTFVLPPSYSSSVSTWWVGLESQTVLTFLGNALSSLMCRGA